MRNVSRGLFLLLIVGLLVAARGAKPPRERSSAGSSPIAAPTAPDLKTVRAAGGKIKPLHVKKRKPQRGDWLDAHREDGQSFDQYLAGRRKRVRDEYATIYVQPLGKFTATERKLTERTADFLGRVYGMPVKTLDTLPLDDVPESAHRVHPTWGGEQILTTYIMDEVLKPRRAKDAVAVLGLTATDLWPGEGWNFVFGQASLVDRVGVWSIQRNGDPHAGDEAYKLCLRRTLKTAAHETGHMLGFQHCTAYECCMNGSNSLDESDRQALWFCPECEQKIWWTCGVDPAKRFRSLIEFAEKNGLDEEAAFWRKSLEKLGGK